MQVQSTSVASQVPVVAQAVSHSACKMPKAQREVKQLNRVNLRTFLDRQHGKFVSVDYTKLGGEKRTLTGRLGVTAFLKGGENKVMRDERPYLTMFDIKLCQYRTVKLDTVTHVRAQGCAYSIID